MKSKFRLEYRHSVRSKYRSTEKNGRTKRKICLNRFERRLFPIRSFVIINEQVEPAVFDGDRFCRKAKLIEKLFHVTSNAQQLVSICSSIVD